MLPISDMEDTEAKWIIGGVCSDSMTEIFLDQVSFSCMFLVVFNMVRVSSREAFEIVQVSV